jgi:hypothetical protein
MKKIFYFCTVKTIERLEVAAKMQRFLCPNFLLKLDTKRIKVCGSSNARKVTARLYLTAPYTLSFV